MGSFKDQTSGIGIGNSFSAGAMAAFDGGTWSLVSPTEVDLAFTLNGNAGTLKLGGSGFALDPNTGLLTGTVKSFDETYNGTHLYKLTGISVDIATLATLIDNRDAAGLFNALYSGNDTFHLSHASASAFPDSLYGGDGNDTFDFGAKFNRDDVVNGGSGNDKLLIHGTYADTIFLDGDNAAVETVVLGKGNSYTIAHTGAFGQFLTIDGTVLGAHATLTVAPTLGEDYGNFTILGGAGNDSLEGGVNDDFLSGGDGNDTLTGDAGADLMHGGAGRDIFVGAGDDVMFGESGADTFQLKSTGHYTTSGGKGDDAFFVDDQFGTFKIDGGSGTDTVTFQGTGHGFVLAADSLQNVETVIIDTTSVFALTMNNGNLASGKTLTVTGNALGTLTFDGSAETKGAFHVSGGRNADTLTGGGGDDILTGGNGGDHLTGGGGHDTFVYTLVANSDGTHTDTITGFDADADKIDLWFTVQAVDAAVTTGSFGTLALASHHAVEFAPNTGAGIGKDFLVVDVNGVAGYQSGVDLVIILDKGVHLDHLSTGDFI